MRSILYIINPISGTRGKKDLQALIEKETTKAGIHFLILPSVADGNYDFLHPIIKEKKITDVVVAGGDGTVSQVVNGLMSLDLNIGIIPCGSGNGLAFTAGIPKDPAKALQIVFAGKAAPTDGFYLNDHFACMLCGLGFDAKVAHDFAQQPKRGLSTYVKQVVRNFFGAKTYPFELTVGGKTFSTDAYFISIANSNQFGNHFTIAPAASLSDGLLDIVIVTKQNKLSMILQTLKQVRGKNKLVPETVIDDTKAVIYFQTNQLHIQNKDEAYLHIDGDPAETLKEIKVEVLAKCFKLLQ
ncbi:MAG: YegS/Rv2252/BmrU family lipid kinase [Chitinophagaceae bacterium]|nr:YegS/Rv2252/BmrU family lipid kinase [Chitinophagaceae bacterium]